MSSHTPGPWRVIDDGSVVGVQMGLAGGFLIDSKANPDANARLIAAAPDLLDALQRIRESSGDPIIENICNSAIAKAEGQQ